jgi:SAM-dependent methyltransferase
VHEAVIEYVEAAVRRYGLDGGAVLDIGGRDVNGTTRGLFPGATYTVVDINEAPNVDIVADAADLDLPDRYDVVVCTEVLEHAERAPEIVAAAYRHLIPHGAFVATMAGPGRRPHSAHGDPDPRPGEFYSNVVPSELEHWLTAAGFSTFTVDQHRLDIRCTAFRGRD